MYFLSLFYYAIEETASWRCTVFHNLDLPDCFLMMSFNLFLCPPCFLQLWGCLRRGSRELSRKKEKPVHLRCVHFTIYKLYWFKKWKKIEKQYFIGTAVYLLLNYISWHKRLSHFFDARFGQWSQMYEPDCATRISLSTFT